MKTNDKALRFKRISVIIFLVLIVSGALAVYFRFGKQLTEIIKDKSKFKAWLESFGVNGQITFVCVRALQTIFKFIPAEPLEIGSGYLYGTWGGLFLCSLGTLIGSLIIIVFSKLFGEKMVNLFVPTEKIKNLKFLKDKKKLSLSLFVLYLMPGTPKDLLTYCLCFIDMNPAIFLLITTAARIPSIITSTWCGNELETKNYIASIVIFAVTGLFTAIGVLIYKKYFVDDKKTEDT